MLSGKIKAEKTTKVHFPTAEEKKKCFLSVFNFFCKTSSLAKEPFWIHLCSFYYFLLFSRKHYRIRKTIYCYKRKLSLKSTKGFLFFVTFVINNPTSQFLTKKWKIHDFISFKVLLRYKRKRGGRRKKILDLKLTWSSALKILLHMHSLPFYLHNPCWRCDLCRGRARDTLK